VLASLLAAFQGGCGGSSHKSASTPASSSPSTTPSTPSTSSSAPGAGAAAPPSSAVVVLAARLLRGSDLIGFTPHGSVTAVTRPDRWVEASEPGAPADARKQHVARLQRLGFTGAAREQLEADAGGGAEAISVVERFGAPSAARAELQGQLAQLQAQGGFTSFAVPGIPGARGLATTPGGAVSGVNVAFAKGADTYLVGIGAPAGRSPSPSRADLIAAAKRLYARVQP